jgi:hypothetical protein
MAAVMGLRTVATRLAAAQVALRERTGQQIVGDREATEKFGFALPEAGGLRAAGLGVRAVDLMVNIPSEQQKSREMFGMRK